MINNSDRECFSYTAISQKLRIDLLIDAMSIANVHPHYLRLYSCSCFNSDQMNKCQEGSYKFIVYCIVDVSLTVCVHLKEQMMKRNPSVHASIFVNHVDIKSLSTSLFLILYYLPALAATWNFCSFLHCSQLLSTYMKHAMAQKGIRTNCFCFATKNILPPSSKTMSHINLSHT